MNKKIRFATIAILILILGAAAYVVFRQRPNDINRLRSITEKGN